MKPDDIPHSQLPPAKLDMVQVEFILQSILNRLVRIETRLVRLMLHHNVTPGGDTKEHP